jgi:NADH-quinone oxidoreductase subunit L
VSTEIVLQSGAAAVSLIGIYLAYLVYLRSPRYAESLVRTGWGTALHRLWFAGWGFDRLYDSCLVRPYVWLAHADREDVVDLIYRGIAALTQGFNRLLTGTQTGKVRWYATGIAIGAVIVIAITVIL